MATQRSREEENKELVRRGYEAFSAGDVETVMGLFDDDVEWVQPGNSTLSGTYRGKGEVVEYMGRLAEKTMSVRVDGLIADGDVVVALTEVSVDGETGHDAEVFTIRNGKTLRVVVHTDTAMMERVYGTKKVAAR